MTDHSESRQQRKEMQQRINKQYIDSKVHPIIEPMANALFSQAGPNDDPVSFCLISNVFRLNLCLTTSPIENLASIAIIFI